MFKVSFFNSEKPEHQIPYDCFQFSGGELQVHLNWVDTVPKDLRYYDTHIHITANMTEPSHTMELVLLVDALRRRFAGTQLSLSIPYLPYARQDRVMARGEALSIKVFTDIINSLGFRSVEVWDAHSDVSLALLDNVIHREQVDIVPKLAKNWVWTAPYLVSPDAGALKKVSKIAQQLQWPMVRADKTRSVVDGSITGTVVYSEHIGNRDFLILDDICDGGKSFVELAKVIRPITDGKIYLYVTHGIFSKGLTVFDGLIDHIYCANPFPKVDLSDPILTIV